MTNFEITLYAACVVTCLTCALLLVRTYLRDRSRLLLWSAICFVCLTVNNVLVFVDLLVLPDADLRVARLGFSLIGMLFLVGGLIVESSK